MSIESLSSEDNAKLRRVIDEGVHTATKIKDLREAQRDLVKAVAEEFQLDVKDLNKAIRIAVKESLDAEKATIDNIEQILQLVGRS
jgi:N-acetylglucosamine kinase-like BadF-type ATPase